VRKLQHPPPSQPPFAPPPPSPSPSPPVSPPLPPPPFAWMRGDAPHLGAAPPSPMPLQALVDTASGLFTEMSAAADAALASAGEQGGAGGTSARTVHNALGSFLGVGPTDGSGGGSSGSWLDQAGSLASGRANDVSGGARPGGGSSGSLFDQALGLASGRANDASGGVQRGSGSRGSLFDQALGLSTGGATDAQLRSGRTGAGSGGGSLTPGSLFDMLASSGGDNSHVRRGTETSPGSLVDHALSVGMGGGTPTGSSRQQPTSATAGSLFDTALSFSSDGGSGGGGAPSGTGALLDHALAAAAAAAGADANPNAQAGRQPSGSVVHQFRGIVDGARTSQGGADLGGGANRRSDRGGAQAGAFFDSALDWLGSSGSGGGNPAGNSAPSRRGGGLPGTQPQPQPQSRPQRPSSTQPSFFDSALGWLSMRAESQPASEPMAAARAGQTTMADWGTIAGIGAALLMLSVGMMLLAHATGVARGAGLRCRHRVVVGPATGGHDHHALPHDNLNGSDSGSATAAMML